MERVRVRCAILSILGAIAACWLPFPAEAATPWLGVTLGEPFAQAYAILGDPRSENAGRDDDVYSYSLAGNADLEVITFRGRIAEMRLMRANADPKLPDPTIPDPKGVQLGSDKSAIFRARGTPAQQNEHEGLIRAFYVDGGAVWEYEIDDNSGLMVPRGSVIDIAEFLPMEQARKMTPAALPALHSGESASDAFVSPTRAYALPVKQYEQEYFRDRSCHRTTLPSVPDVQPIYDAKWTIASTRTISQAGGKYDVVTARCVGGMSRTPQIFEQRDFYFKD